MFHISKKLLALSLASSLVFSGSVLAKGKPDLVDNVKNGKSMQNAKDKVRKDKNEMYDRLERADDNDRSDVAKWEQDNRAESAEMRARHRAEMDALKNDESLSGKDRAQQMKTLRKEHHQEKKAVRDLQKNEKREFMNERKDAHRDKDHDDKDHDDEDHDDDHDDVNQHKDKNKDKANRDRDLDREYRDELEDKRRDAEERRRDSDAVENESADNELNDKAKDATAKKPKKAWWKFWGD